jgi:hypothetical protein
MPLYVFDANIWIHLGRNHPQDIFVTLWSRIDGAIQAGEVCSPDEVCQELAQGTDELADDLRQRNGLFVPLTADLQAAVGNVMAQCPSLTDPESERNRADPFVVALAGLRQGVVVSNERSRRAATAPMKVPDACSHLGIRHLDWFGFLRERNWRI